MDSFYIVVNSSAHWLLSQLKRKFNSNPVLKSSFDCENSRENKFNCENGLKSFKSHLKSINKTQR